MLLFTLSSFQNKFFNKNNIKEERTGGFKRWEDVLACFGEQIMSLRLKSNSVKLG